MILVKQPFYFEIQNSTYRLIGKIKYPNSSWYRDIKGNLIRKDKDKTSCRYWL